MAEAAPRLYLISPRLVDAASFAPALEAALAAGDVACLLLRLGNLAASDSKKLLTTLVPLAQKQDVAVLVEDPMLAGRFDADGVHVAQTGAELDAALAAMKQGKIEKIVGVGGIETRHDAMTAGETGVDYLMFGGPDDAQAADRETVAWWAEIATVPCVAYAATLADVRPLAAAGVEFVALGDAVWQHADGAAAAVAAAMADLGRAHEPAP